MDLVQISICKIIVEHSHINKTIHQNLSYFSLLNSGIKFAKARFPPTFMWVSTALLCVAPRINKFVNVI